VQGWRAFLGEDGTSLDWVLSITATCETYFKAVPERYYYFSQLSQTILPLAQKLVFPYF